MCDTKIMEIAELLGRQDCVVDNVLTLSKPKYSCTLSETGDGKLKASLTYARAVSPEMLGKAAVKLATANNHIAMSGFYMDEDGVYGQHCFFSSKDDSRNIAFSIYIMMDAAHKFVLR